MAIRRRANFGKKHTARSLPDWVLDVVQVDGTQPEFLHLLGRCFAASDRSIEETAQTLDSLSNTRFVLSKSLFGIRTERKRSVEICLGYCPAGARAIAQR